MGLTKTKCSGIKAVELKRELQKKLDAELNSMPRNMPYIEKLHKKARSSRLVKKFLARAK